MPAPVRSAPDDAELDLRYYVSLIFRKWWVIALTVGVAVAVALVATAGRSTTYRATASILFEQPLRLTEDGSVNLQDTVLENERALFESELVRASVAEVYDGPIAPNRVQASGSGREASVLTASVSATDPAEAEQLLDVYLNEFVRLRRQNRLDQFAAISAEIDTQIEELTARITEMSNTSDNPVDRIEDALLGDLEPLLRQRAAFEAQAQALMVEHRLLDLGDATILGSADASDEPANEPTRGILSAAVAGAVVGIGLVLIRDWMIAAPSTRADRS